MIKILERGLKTILDDNQHELVLLLQRKNLPSEWLSTLLGAVQDIPNLILKMNKLVFNENAPVSLRALFPSILNYLLDDEDLIPSHKDQEIIGLLDDAYLVHKVATILSENFSDFEAASSKKFLEVLVELIPSNVKEQLDRLIDDTFVRVVGEAERIGF